MLELHIIIDMEIDIQDACLVNDFLMKFDLNSYNRHRQMFCFGCCVVCCAEIENLMFII